MPVSGSRLVPGSRAARRSTASRPIGGCGAPARAQGRRVAWRGHRRRVRRTVTRQLGAGPHRLVSAPSRFEAVPPWVVAEATPLRIRLIAWTDRRPSVRRGIDLRVSRCMTVRRSPGVQAGRRIGGGSDWRGDDGRGGDAGQQRCDASGCGFHDDVSFPEIASTLPNIPLWVYGRTAADRIRRVVSPLAAEPPPGRSAPSFDATGEPADT
jgi:hypothetical protein